MFSAFHHFGKQGVILDPSELGGGGGGSTTPANGYVAEDGTTFYVAEDGVTYYVQEDTYVPAVASAAGYNTTAFFDDFTTQTVDLAGAHTGKNWYIDNAPNFAAPHTGLGSNPAWFSDASSVLALANNYNTSVSAPFQCMSVYSADGITFTHQVPLLSGATGFYVEGRMQAVPQPESVQPMPDFWLYSIATLQQLYGVNFPSPGAEIDIFEMNSSAGDAFQTYHEVDPSNSQTSGATLTGLDYTQYHRWGALVIPRSLGGGTGSLTWYVDGSVSGTPITWTGSGQLGYLIESMMFEINFGAAYNSALNVDYIGVWTP